MKESGRKCSHCGRNGHNSRTCNEKEKEKVGMKLFGVILKNKEVDLMKKSFSMGNLQACEIDKISGDPGYLSDGLIHSRKAARERKKGVPWTEQEHRTFLAGLEKLGKGDWRGIARNFVMTRTPTQVASHAQKYFLRQAASSRKKRRSSLFDVAIGNPSSPRQITQDLSLKNSIEALDHQISTPAKVSSQVVALGLEDPSIIPMATTYGAHNFSGFPYVAGISGGRLSYPAAKIVPSVSFVPVVNLMNRNVYLTKTHNNFATCAPITFQLSSTMSPKSGVDDSSSLPELGTSSSTVNTNLELGQSQIRNGTKMSRQTSSIGGAISVV